MQNNPDQGLQSEGNVLLGVNLDEMKLGMNEKLF